MNKEILVIDGNIIKDFKMSSDFGISRIKIKTELVLHGRYNYSLYFNSCVIYGECFVEYNICTLYSIFVIPPYS